MASEKSSGAISVSAFQLVTATRYRSVEYEARQCHTDTSKSRLGLVRREIVSADLQFIGAFEVDGTTRISTACCVPQRKRPTARLRLRNDLYCVEWGVKLYSLTHLLPDRQSAYRAHHSTETAVLRVMSDILLALDSGNIAVLTLLDLSATFDSVDHSTLLQPLQTSNGLGGPVLA